MAKETGRDIGSKIGTYLETDRRSWQTDHAKFMKICVALKLDQLLHRGGYITNLGGERIWVTFKYEKLSTICYTCGKIGHDDKHCPIPQDEQTVKHQYGDWIRANGNHRGNQERVKSREEDSYPSRNKGERSGSQMARNGIEDPTTDSNRLIVKVKI